MAPETGKMTGDLLTSDKLSVPSQITQEVRNRNLLNTMFKVSLKDEMLWQEPLKVALSPFDSDVFSFQFKKDAPLRQFIHDITKVQKNYYSLAEVSIG